MRKNYDIYITSSKNISDEIISCFKSDLEDAGLHISIKKRTEPQEYKAFEWCIPTFVIVYLAKPYFETILKELAKDHYPHLKKAFNGFFSKLFRVKASKKQHVVSMTFFLCFETKDGQTVKFIFDDSKDQGTCVLILQDAYILMLNHYKNYPDDEITKQVDKYIEAARTLKEIIYQYNFDSRKWIVKDNFAQINS